MMTLLVATVVFAVGATARAKRAHPQGSPSVPAAISVRPFAPAIKRTIHYETNSEFIRVAISIETASKKVRLSWKAKAGASAVPTTFDSTETVSFSPTAICRSRVNPRGFYIAGKSATAPVLEFWEFNDDEDFDSEWHSQSSSWQTVFAPPTLAKSTRSISTSFGWPCAMTVKSPTSTSGVDEEVWAMEWESRNVYAIATNGALTTRIASSIGSLYREIEARNHSIYGDVIILRRKPWNVDLIDWLAQVEADPSIDPDQRCLYDQDLDGTLDGTMTVDQEDITAHPMYLNGEWTDLEQ